MSSYGHPVRFGIQIVSAGGEADAAPRLAHLADELGYDAVLFADRPDDGGLDSPTLASWAAARTSTVHLAPRLHPTTRPASIVARTAGSLQLLSRDRAALVLEAGPAPDDLGAAEEAVAVVRTLLNPSGRGRVSHHGAHHRLSGAEAGPSLDREVPIWLAGRGPEAAGLAGRIADGWLVDLDSPDDDIDADGLGELNATLDAAATAAGRDPREVRRAVTLPARAATEVAPLVRLVVEHGVGLVVLRVAADVDPAALKAFVTEVAPAVREGAEHALPGAFSARPPRRADVRALRREAIGYDEVPEDLVDTVVEPGDAAYAKHRSTYLRGGNPGLVLRPGSPEEVASALAFARTHRHLPLGIRSGGHGISGRSTNDGGLVLDVGRLDDVTVLDASERLVRIGPGARWRDVATVLQPHGWALTSGDYGGVGVGGLATAGGIGFLGRKHGLTIDHLRAVEVVLADGSLVRASETENPELFWGMRGAGANLGVGVAFEFVIDEVDQVGWAQLAFRAPDPAAWLEAFGATAMAAPRETTPFVIVGQGMAQVMAMVDSTDPDTIIEQLQPFAEIAPLVQQQVVIAPYAAVMNQFPEAPHDGRGEPVSRSALTREITPGFAAASADLISSGASHWYQIRTVGGAISDVPADATAYAHREANFALAVMGANAQRLDRWFDPLREESEGLYLSFESDVRPERLADAFPPATLRRLRRLKGEVDPHNLFQDNFNITPDTTRSDS